MFLIDDIIIGAWLGPILFAAVVGAIAHEPKERSSSRPTPPRGPDDSHKAHHWQAIEGMTEVDAGNWGDPS